MDLTHELDVALGAARAGAAIVREVYARAFDVDWKGANDPVTEADRRANAAIESILRGAFPSDALCAEESDLARSSAEAARGGRCWMVDPLDGTREFVARNGEFCVMVGLAVDGRPALGVVLAPAWERTLVGVVGVGAFELLPGGSRRTLRVSALAGPPRMLVSRSHPHPAVQDVARAMGVTSVRACGSAGLKVSLVAAGEADVYVHTGTGLKLWDGCAPEAIARAAGAEVTDAHGRALRYATPRLALDDGIVVGAPATVQRAVAALRTIVQDPTHGGEKKL